MKKLKTRLYIITTCASALFTFFSNSIHAQTNCTFGVAVFKEDFGSGTARLGPSLNQDPNNVHPNFRPADLYTYVGTGSVGQDQYGIMKTPKDAAPNGADWNDDFPDHTGNPNGYLYYCDAKEDLNVFYAQKIDGLCDDIQYELSAWFAKTNAPDYFIDPNIKLIIGYTDINDQNIGSIVEADTGPIEGVGTNRWHRRSLVFSVPTGTENIYFMLKNNVAGLAGNDLAIDDIQIRPCGPVIDSIDQLTSDPSFNNSFCITDTSNNTISLSANVPNSFAMQWQESTTPGVWVDIPNETSSVLNHTIPANSNATHLIRLKFAHTLANLLNSKCHFLSEVLTYNKTYANQASHMQLCDDTGDGKSLFDLSSQNNFINAGGGVTITYHSSQNDADTGNSPLPNMYDSGNATIYARVENNTQLLGNICYTTTSFNLEVYSTVINTPISALSSCDNTSVGADTDGYNVFDLTLKETELLNGQSSSDFTITYFIDAAYTTQITTPNAFVNTTASGQTIYVRITNNLNPICYTETSFNIEVLSLPDANYPNTYSQCDDASNDGQAFFNLTLNHIKEEINPNYLSEGLMFSYYENKNQADSATSPIVNPTTYQNSIGFAPETVWVRVENPNGCFRVVPLTLEVNPSSAALNQYNPPPFSLCDNGPNNRDGFSTFDLTGLKNHISNTIFSTFNVTVHFYESQLDAELETNELTNIANYQNTIANSSQSLWVRVKSDLGNNCLGLKEFANILNVEALPTANPVTINRQCDFDTTDTVVNYPFDTSQIETDLLNGQSSTNVTVTYFDENNAPLPSPLPNPFLTESQTITARVTNNATSAPNGPCYDETTIEFIVDEQPIANPVFIPAVCDGDDGFDDADGLHHFDTSTIQNNILGMQTGMDVYYSYLDEFGSQITNSPSLPNPFVSGTQTITVDVINPTNPTCTASTNIDFIVNPLPDFSIETPQIVCSSDPTFTIILDPLEDNPSENFVYEWVYEDGTTLSNNPTLTVSTPGTYSVTLTKTDGTGCSRTRDVFVNASELATITLNDVVIVDISDNNSITINETNLGLGDYEYALDEEFSFYQDEPFFDNIKAGFHTVYVRDKKGCGTSSIDVSVIGYPKYFTPNGDGVNDYWQILGVNNQFQPNSTIQIFDRYGKLIKQIQSASAGWNGTFNGELLNTDDYWFKVYLEDGRQFMGHFTLKR
ncbi:T9SS type B sorting domain-containing protein [Hwangdonia lutea]|uniref:T9SS type B sorting domain-containing protein n=1 Tax=Hwangdonia lutea TaxID=3075823 RepID=A0AA97EM39_9FLAO|nr:T9SS type B sorting domain-containing protein [Hwangdonia sp. SCSIO 19198]WOD43931.1 T9SS type B sorting domain-containing protein [Hwangdonia sp. SCSIO 19198]